MADWKAGEIIPQLAAQFNCPGELQSFCPFGNGHINDTFRLMYLDGGRESGYILQRINHHIFKDPPAVMHNIAGVTEFLRKKIEIRGGDPRRETLNIVGTKDGGLYFADPNGSYWRTYLQVSGAVSYDQARESRDFYESGLAFGNFQYMLSDYPVEALSETIPDFHNTPKRYTTFLQAVQEDAQGRVKAVQEEIRFLSERREDMSKAMECVDQGRMPLRVTHNDTKMNNVMFDTETGRAVCVIDLDTVMPGLAIHDFGDAIRFGASTAGEDEQDLSKVSLDLDLFESFTQGFLEGCQGSLTDEEVSMLVMGAKLMTLECGMRFLTDHLQGDTYFKIHRPGHNLDRCRTQLALVADMEKKWEQMQDIVERHR